MPASNPPPRLPGFPAAPPPTTGGKKTLAGVVGSVTAAALLFVLVPKEESGREVKATVEGSQIRVQHVRGRQYLRAYRDVVGVATICDGDTAGVTMATVETPAGCAARLERQLIAHAEPVMRCAPALRGRVNQIVALVDLSYNIGPAGVCRSSIVRKINVGDWAGASAAILLYNRAGGRVNRGLDARRRREKALFDTARPAQGER